MMDRWMKLGRWVGGWVDVWKDEGGWVVGINFFFKVGPNRSFIFSNEQNKQFYIN